ncbi:MAG: transcription-repair coupling factor [Lachnospiraceae bacterium]|nr:transcription-repair coupling factor [Lachnospiraceae bacterium]
MKKLFVEPLTELREYAELRAAMRRKKGILSLTGCVEAQKAQMIYALAYDVPNVVIVAEHDMAARTIYENLRFYEPQVCYYPAKDLLFYQADIASNELDRQRVTVMRKLLEPKEHHVVVLPAAALMDFVTARGVMEAERLTFTVGEESELETIKKALVLLGYERTPRTEIPGQFACRGDILDIWPLTEDLPIRIEYFGDEIDSIRTFDPQTQRSIEEIEETEVYPASDHTGTLKPFISWFDTEKTQFFLDDPNRMLEAVRSTEEEFRLSIEMRMEQGGFSKDELPDLMSAAELTAAFNRSYTIALSMLDIRREHWDLKETYGLTVQAVNTYNNSFEMLTGDLLRYRKRGFRVIVVSASPTRARRLAQGLMDAGIPAYYTENVMNPLSSGQIVVMYGHATRGFEYPLIRFAMISETDIFGEKKEKKRRRREKKDGSDHIASLNDLSVGDYVIHENHGLGIYRGIEKVEVDGALKDYMKIEYSGSNLYILATQLDLLQKYAGGSGDSKPKLNKLGGQEWEKTRTKVRGAVQNIAKDLVELYAKRQESAGHACSPDTEWQREFEELFPYEETDDQLQAIEDTKRDMESRKIMDRLICGDVGYGKTEIAIRAAFKAVQEGLQVVYLVPTTILAQQHFNTFAQRMKDFPVNVELLCRFRTPAQQSQTLKNLKSGMADIVIGTHRLLSKDVSFKNLGLLIIDEEQRFGVAHKEKIKKLKDNVDVLTLTATPIPRTLHMSLIGIRDMTVLEEPPQDRVAIQTYVMEYNPEMVREAICRELGRGGQVYYVYNRVKDIAEVAGKIREMVPEAQVAYAHGQMSERELENIMVDFVNGEIDVLVTTTIIETGLDIGNANTMIIHDADKMGLSQLYQLRGRVGRTSRTAYAFLMYKRDKMLKEVAEKRLAAIREFTELGSGFKIAMRDLEIRGAGNLLGAEQSGHMESVGYDLYCKMLSEAVSEAKGEPAVRDFETTVDLNFNAYIPDSYIPDEFQKLDFYKRIAAIQDSSDYDDVLDELIDRFGEPPKAVTNLMKIAELKSGAHRGQIAEIKQTGRQVKIVTVTDPAFDVRKIPGIISGFGGRFTIHVYPTETYFLYHGALTEEELLPALADFAKALEEAV